MCNLYANTTAQDEMRRLFDVAPGHDLLGNAEPQPAIFPKDTAPVVRRREDGTRELCPMQWGFLLPQVSKRTGRPILPKPVTNARDDKLRASPFWRESFETRRCLVPASAFCEPRGRNPAVHHWFALAAEDEEARPPFAFAGLWRRWRGEIKGEAADLAVYAIVTTRPNPLVAQVHPRPDAGDARRRGSRGLARRHTRCGRPAAGPAAAGANAHRAAGRGADRRPRLSPPDAPCGARGAWL